MGVNRDTQSGEAQSAALERIEDRGALCFGLTLTGRLAHLGDGSANSGLKPGIYNGRGGGH